MFQVFSGILKQSDSFQLFYKVITVISVKLIVPRGSILKLMLSVHMLQIQGLGKQECESVCFLVHILVHTANTEEVGLC